MSLTTLQAIIDSGVKLTPMMQQYYDIKKAYPDMLLLFRMGDFYEMFFEDAKAAARILNISLTHRGKLGDIPIPMSGIPHHAANTYIDRITSQGLKAAICEQTEDPKEAKGIVRRAVTQVVSPGMPYDLDKTEKSDQRFMVSAHERDGHFGLIAMDFTTGDFKGSRHEDIFQLIEAIRLYSPRELITYMGQWDSHPPMKDFLQQADILKTYLSSDYFNSKHTSMYSQKLIPSFQHDKVLAGAEYLIAPLGALSYYVLSTQGVDQLVHLRPFRLLSEKNRMKVTLSTLIGLEILPKSRERYHHSLLGYFDRTMTAMGGRKLKELFLHPLRDRSQIITRQTAIQYFITNSDTLEFIRQQLSDIRDLERIMAKVTTGKVNAGDIINISRAIFSFRTILGNLPNFPQGAIEDLMSEEILALTELAERIALTINDEIGASLEKGNLIRSGCHAERDRLANLSTNWAEQLLVLENRYREETGISKLRIKSNNINGHFIEVSKVNSKQVPEFFQRRQTLVNSERYVTAELLEFEKEVFASQEKLERLERELFKEIISEIERLSATILCLSNYLAMLDCFQSLGHMAIQEELSCPVLIEGNKKLHIKKAWHPLIRSILKDQFITHDLTLDQSCYFGLITGPNMAGKTTVMREVAIIQLLAQIGSFVPAQRAELGICDYLFSRLGANDDILQGQSTFMVEMSETAEIIRHATENSLIILDEVGRGTSTYDGLSIAWALVEYFIKQTKAITLFATHYHELIELVDGLDYAKNLTVETVSKNGDVKFLYRLIEQGASQSYGIFVAKLAGLPIELLERSSNILKTLEEDSIGHNEKINKVCRKKNDQKQLSIFDSVTEQRTAEIPLHLLQLEEQLKKIDLQHLTPLQALNKLDQLITLLK